MRLKFTLSFLFTCLMAFTSFATVDIFNHAVVINGTTQSSSTNLGAFAPNSLSITGSIASSWQNSGDEVCTTYMDYSVSGGGSSGTVTLTQVGSTAGNGDKNWAETVAPINVSNLPNGTYTLTLNYRVFGRWGNVGCGSSANPFNTTTLESLTITFTINSALPVTLTRFDAQATDSGNQLTWNTETERNLSHYAIERSLDSKLWKQIGTVQPQSPNSTERRVYNFTDDTPTSRVNYYRLRVIDLDGSNELSAMVVVRTKSKLDVAIYPNPVADYLTIESEPITEATIFNQFGQVVRSIKSSGANRFDLSDLNAGFYQLVVRLEDGSIRQGQKFVKL